MKKALRIVAVMVMLSLVISLMVGCGGTASTQASPSADASASAAPAETKAPVENVKMRVNTTFTGADAWTATWQEVYKKFVADNAGVEITDESTPTANDAIRTKLKTDFASGNEPDVAFFFNGSDTKPLLESGKILAWDDELKNDTAWSANFSPAALDAVKYEGKVYALPYIGYYEGVFYNKDLFDANGLALPKTYEDLLKAVEVFKSKNIIPIAASIDESYYLIETFVLSMGGVAGHSNAFDASWAPALNLVKDLYTKGAFPKDALTLPDNNARELFYAKKAAIMINGSWCVGALKDNTNTVIGPLPLVTGGKGDATDMISGFGSGWYLSKALNDSKGNVPMKFVKYMTTPEVMGKFIAVGGSPAIKCEVANDTPAAKSGRDALTGAAHITVPIDSKITPESFTAIRKGLAYVVTGKKTAEKLLEEAQKLNVKK